MASWMTLSQLFKGWTLSDIKEMSYRERMNWLEIAREYGKVVKNRE